MEKPVPRPNADSAPFWEGCAAHEFRFQRCRGCGKVQFYPRAVCSHCQGRDLKWEISAGKGTVHSVTTVYRGPSAAFKEDSPYQVALVDMDEGFRFMANVRGGEAGIGTRVRVIYEKRGDQTIPQVEIGGVRMFTYDHFEVGENYGSDTFTVGRDRIAKWLAVYPDDDNGDLMPPGMTAMIQIQCYMACITPRPKGNVHGSQVFELHRLPKVGETLTTEVECTNKEIRKGRKWVETTYTTRDGEGDVVFTGVMTTLVAA